jgi:hypothetical protein
MSNKKLPATRSIFVVYSNPNPEAAHSDNHRHRLHRFIPAVVLRLTLATLGRFASDVACAVADGLAAALVWLAQEFVTGCAAYAEAMHPLPAIRDHRDAAPAHPTSATEPARVSPAPVAARD